MRGREEKRWEYERERESEREKKGEKETKPLVFGRGKRRDSIVEQEKEKWGR